VLYVFNIADETKFLGAFAKLRAATVSFAMTVRVEQLGCDKTDFHEI
jgi:hypothetical protein